jgi:hypothetical protein
MSGAAGGGGCAGADLGSDPLNCGSCGNECVGAEECLDGTCADAPCDGLCETSTPVPLSGDGFRFDNIGTVERCFEVVGYVRDGSEPTVICWNFQAPRTLEVNGQAIECVTEPGAGVGDPRAGGYCLKVGAGNHDFAGFKFPLP